MALSKKELEDEIKACEKLIRTCEHGIIVNTIVKKAFEKELKNAE